MPFLSFRQYKLLRLSKLMILRWRLACSFLFWRGRDSFSLFYSLFCFFCFFYLFLSSSTVTLAAPLLRITSTTNCGFFFFSHISAHSSLYELSSLALPTMYSSDSVAAAVCSCVFPTLAILAVGFRVRARRMQQTKLGADDWLMIVALVGPFSLSFHQLLAYNLRLHT